MIKRELLNALATVPDTAEIHIGPTLSGAFPEARLVQVVTFNAPRHSTRVAAYVTDATMRIPDSATQSVRITHDDFHA